MMDINFTRNEDTAAGSDFDFVLAPFFTISIV